MSSSPSARASKRSHNSAEATIGDGGKQSKKPRADEQQEQEILELLPELSPDLWARVLPYSTYRMTLRCSILNRMFLHSVSPKIKQITVFHPHEMTSVKAASRFTGVEKIIISCLLRASSNPDESDGYKEYDEDREYIADSNVVFRFVPFLSAFAPKKLKEVMISTIFNDSSPYGHSGYLCYEDLENKGAMDEQSTNTMMTLQRTVGGAYSSGLLDTGVNIIGEGRMCPKLDSFNENVDEDEEGEDKEECPHCVLCQNYPVHHVALWVIQTSACCISAERIVEILIGRPGSKEFLSSKKFILDGCEFPKDLAKVKPILQKNGLSCSTISRSDVLDWLNGGGGVIRRCRVRLHLLDKTHFDTLKDLGVPVEFGDIPSESEEKYLKKKFSELTHAAFLKAFGEQL